MEKRKDVCICVLVYVYVKGEGRDWEDIMPRMHAWGGACARSCVDPKNGTHAFPPPPFHPQPTHLPTNIYMRTCMHTSTGARTDAVPCDPHPAPSAQRRPSQAGRPPRIHTAGRAECSSSRGGLCAAPFLIICPSVLSPRFPLGSFLHEYCPQALRGGQCAAPCPFSECRSHVQPHSCA